MRAEVVGSDHLKLSLRVGPRELSAFGFGIGARRPELAARVRIYGSLRADTYRGGDRVELRIVELENA
jgi:hypothetical protein